MVMQVCTLESSRVITKKSIFKLLSDKAFVEDFLTRPEQNHKMKITYEGPEKISRERLQGFGTEIVILK